LPWRCSVGEIKAPLSFLLDQKERKKEGRKEGRKRRNHEFVKKSILAVHPAGREIFFG